MLRKARMVAEGLSHRCTVVIVGTTNALTDITYHQLPGTINGQLCACGSMCVVVDSPSNMFYPNEKMCRRCAGSCMQLVW